MTTNSMLLNRVLRMSVTIGAGFYLLAFSAISIWRMRYPFELEWLEGGGLQHVHRILAGLPIYTKPSLDFIAFPYTPLYYYVSAVVARVIGLDFFAMRLVSFSAAMAMLALIAAIVARETGRWYPAWLACGLMAATYGLTDGWFDVARVDSLFLATFLGGVYAVQRGTRRALLTAGVFFGLSFLVKQTALMMAMPLMGWSIVKDRRESVFLIAPAVLVLAASTLYFQRTTDGWYWYYVFDLQRTAGVFIGSRLLTFWTKDVLSTFVVAAALSCWYLFTSARMHSSRSAQSVGVATTAMILATWASRLRSGNYLNVLMPAYASLAILSGFAIADLEAMWHEFDERSRRRLNALLSGLCIFQFLELGFNPFSEIPRRGDEIAGREVVRRLAAVDGEVFVPCHGYLAAMAGKRAYAHVQEIVDVGRGADSAIADAMKTDLRAQFEQRRFSAVFPCSSHMNILEAAGFSMFYIKQGVLFGAGDDSFKTVAGVPLRPEWIYTPRIVPAGPAQ